MKNENMPAMPFEGGQNNGIEPSTGLTKREHFALHFACAYLQGQLASNSQDWYSTPAHTDCACEGRNYADALLAELEKTA